MERFREAGETYGEKVMSLQALIQGILDKGTAERNELVGAAKAEMQRILRETGETGKQDISRRMGEARAAAERMRVQETARSELESRKLVLAAQKEVLDSVKAEVLKRLGSPEIRSELTKTLLDKTRNEWQAGRIFCSPADEKQVKAIAGSRFGGTLDCAGGLVIESEDGTRRLDVRFETILQDIWEDSVKELADLLWPQR